MTSSCCSCHHAACTWPHWPPGPSNEAYLSSPHQEASPAMTFRACSSPAPTPVKPQPAPAILSQESVHTTWSITHHTRKRPSTSPRTTHGPHIGNCISVDYNVVHPICYIFMSRWIRETCLNSSSLIDWLWIWWMNFVAPSLFWINCC
jgi:hypothetical protein